jgi:hypothetical protein
MDAVSKREPRLERIVHELGEEHRQFEQSLEGLLGEARAATAPDDTFRKRIRAWIKQLRRHEERENTLVQETFGLDLSAED